MPPQSLLKRRLRVLAFIVRFQARHGYPPTVREIARGTGLPSAGTMQRHLNWLIEAGYLERRRSFRQLWCVHDPPQPVGEER